MYVSYSFTNARNEAATFVRRLAKAARFRESDLADNRRGRLSTLQMARMTLGALVPIAGLLLSIAAIAVAADELNSGLSNWAVRGRYLLATGWFGSLGLGVLLAAVLAILARLVQAASGSCLLLLDLMFGKVSMITGRVAPSRSCDAADGLLALLNPGAVRFHLVAKGEYFEVSEAAYEAMLEVPGAVFCLYVTPRGRHLVAIDFAAEELVASHSPYSLG